MLGSIGPRLLDRGEKLIAHGDSQQEKTEDSRGMLTPGEAEIWEQRERTSCPWAEEPTNGDSKDVGLAGWNYETVVPPVEAEAVMVIAEGTSAVLVGDEATRRGEIGLDPTFDSAYLLQLNPLERNTA